jgi:hypothetical protein
MWSLGFSRPSITGRKYEDKAGTKDGYCLPPGKVGKQESVENRLGNCPTINHIHNYKTVDMASILGLLLEA